MSELENRLAGLGGLPVAPLAGAEAARLRGEQRTRRTRAGLAGAGALVAVLALSAGAALGGGGPERIAPPPAGPGPVEEGLSVSLLDPEDVAAVRGGEWEVRATEDFPFDPLPSGCAGPDVFGSPEETALRFVDGPEPVGHSLKAYAGPIEAQVAFERVVASIRTCGETSDGPQVVAGEPASTTTRTYGTLSAGTRTVVFAIERIEAVLSGVAIRSFELNDIPPLADAAAAEVAGGPFTAPDPAGSQADDGLLRPQDMEAVKPGPWSADGLGDGEGGLSDCQRGDELNRRDGGPSAGRVPYVGTHLRLPVTIGLTNVQQYVMTFPDATAAAQSYEAHADALRACRTEEITEQEADPPLEVLSVATHEVVLDGADRLVVRTSYACDTCGDRASYRLVVQVGTRLAVVAVFGEEKVSPALVEALPDTVAARLAEAG